MKLRLASVALMLLAALPTPAAASIFSFTFKDGEQEAFRFTVNEEDALISSSEEGLSARFEKLPAVYSVASLAAAGVSDILFFKPVEGSTAFQFSFVANSPDQAGFSDRGYGLRPLPGLFQLDESGLKVNLGTFNIDDSSLSVQVERAPTDAIPEPSAWVLMIGGFFAIGYSLRASRTSFARQPS